MDERAHERAGEGIDGLVTPHGSRMGAEGRRPPQRRTALRLLFALGVLAEAAAAFHRVLDRYSLADIVRDRDALSAIVHLHQPVTTRAGRAQALP